MDDSTESPERVTYAFMQFAMLISAIKVTQREMKDPFRQWPFLLSKQIAYLAPKKRAFG